MNAKDLTELVSANIGKFEELYGIAPTAVGAVSPEDDGNMWRYIMIALEDLNNDEDLSQFISDISNKEYKLKLLNVGSRLEVKELEL